MSARKLSAGDNIEARCTRCRKMLNHTIVAMVGDRVVRVECNTCRGMHNYHGAPAVKTPASSATRKTGTAPGKARKKSGDADREEWESYRPTLETRRSVAYDMSGKYRANDVVEHAVFGLGLVKAVVGPNKMEVLFQEGRKLLRCQ